MSASAKTHWKKGAQNINLETRASKPYGHEVRFRFHSDLARMMLTLHRDLHHAHAHANMPNRHCRRYRLIFFSLPSPKKGGGVGWGRVLQKQHKSTDAAAATAARQGQNEINTAMTRNRLRVCEVCVF
jgi:hypothetical protein